MKHHGTYVCYNELEWSRYHKTSYRVFCFGGKPHPCSVSMNRLCTAPL